MFIPEIFVCPLSESSQMADTRRKTALNWLKKRKSLTAFAKCTPEEAEETICELYSTTTFVHICIFVIVCQNELLVAVFKQDLNTKNDKFSQKITWVAVS